MGWLILLEIKARETINHRLRFSHSGLWLILFEFTVLVILVIGTQKTFLNLGRSLEVPGILGLLLIMNFLLTFGNSYLLSERTLFGFNARVNMFLGVNPKDVILSTFIITYLGNLRPTLQSPTLIAVALTHLWFPELQLLFVGMIFFVPFLSSILAILTVILVKRFAGWLSGLGLITATAFYFIGIVGVTWVVADILKGTTVINLSFLNSPVFQPMFWWLPLMFLSGLLIFIILVNKMSLWEQAVWIQEDRAGRRVGKNHVWRILSLLSALHLPSPVKGVILKEWLFLWRNPLTIFRVVAWAILSLAFFIYGLFPLVPFLSSPLILVFIIWYFCFGELIATAYQAEGNRLGLLWLAAISPKHLAVGKFLAYLPLVFFGIKTAWLIVLILGLKGQSAILTVIYTICGGALGLILALIPACLSMNKVNHQGNSITEMAFEQVPLTLFSIISIMLLGVILAIFTYIITRNDSATGLSSIYLCTTTIGTTLVLGLLGIVTTKFLLKRFYSL